MSKSRSFALVCAGAFTLAAVGCGAHAPAREASAAPPVNQQRLAELDRVIAEVKTNLEATRASAQQADAFEATTTSQLAEFRTKVESVARPEGKKREQPAKAAADQEPATAVQAAVGAFEAKAHHATAVAQLRRAQVAAREARLARLEIEREQVAHPEGVRGSGAGDALEAAQQKEISTKADVERLQVAEQEAELQAAQARDRYQRMRQGDDTESASNANATESTGQAQ